MAAVFSLWIGEPEVGLWCPRCALPSGWRAAIYHVSEQGVSRFGEITQCYDHQGPL
jgi:uncharacterized protein YbdZ (MbtH family)